MNISLYTKTCKRKPEEAMKNMRNMKNPQAGALSCLLQVIQVFHVIHVFQVFPMRACVTGDGHAGVGAFPGFRGATWPHGARYFCREWVRVDSGRTLRLFRNPPKGAMPC